MKKSNLKVLYPLIGTLCAAWGTFALLARNIFAGTLPLWAVLLLVSNIFIAAGIVCGTKEETFSVPNPKATFSKEEPTTVEMTRKRTPALSLILAIAATAFVAYYTRSALDSLLTLLTWGGLAYPIARCILGRKSFGAAMQTGLISTSALTLLAGVIHVFKVAPDHTFRLQYAFDSAIRALRGKILPLLQEAKQILTDSQSLTGTELPQEIVSFSPEQFTDMFIEEVLFFLPAFFAVAVLGSLCILWWCCKFALKRDPAVRVHDMGRLDSFSPSKILFGVYMISFLLYLVGEEGSAIMALGANISAITSAVLAYAGYSLLLFIINTRVSAKPLRILFSVLALIVGLDSCGYQLLTLAGIFSTDTLRQHLGGGTFK